MNLASPVRQAGPVAAAVTALIALTLVTLGLFVASAGAALPPVTVTQVEDIVPGPTSSLPLLEDVGNPRLDTVDINGDLIFTAGGSADTELWRSDGTEAGTYEIKDIAPRVGSSSLPTWLTEMNGEVFFQANEGFPVKQELWKTDGTEEGTVRVKDINPDIGGLGVGNGAPNNLVNVNGTLFFLANSDSANGFELWKSDGTEAGTLMVEDLEIGTIEAENFMAVGNRLVFVYDDGVSGKELWTSDGTAAGTHIVEDIRPGADGGLGAGAAKPKSAYTVFDGSLFFNADDGDGDELWRSDGTEAGTFMVKDLCDDPFGNPDCINFNPEFATLGGELFYGSPFRLVKSDGTGPGTELVSGTTAPKHTVSSGGSIFYAGTGSNTGKIFKTNGNAGGTEEVVDFDHPDAGVPNDLIDFGGILHFAVDDGVNGEELWRSDGTLAGTERLTDINPAGGSNIGGLRALGDRLYFYADDNGATGREVWQVYSDMTPPQTTITGGPAEASTIAVNEVAFTFSSNEPGSTFVCSLDGATPQACNSGSKTYSAIGEGPHTFSVTATDPAPFSNEDPTPATRNFTFTDPPPETTIDTGPAEGETIEVDQATFTFSSNEPGSTFTCSLDAGAPEQCDSGSKTYTGLAEGAHTFSVTATGPAPFAKVDPTPATRSFTYTEATMPPVIDTAAPTLRLKGRKVQKSPKRIVLKATCVDEACSLVAAGNIRVKVLKKNGKVKKTRKLKLNKRRASGEAGETVTLKVKLNRKTKKLVKKALRKKKASKATIRVRASDAAGNSSSAKRKVKVKKKR